MKTKKSLNWITFIQQEFGSLIPKRISEDYRMPYAALMIALFFGFLLQLIAIMTFLGEGVYAIAFVNMGFVIYYCSMLLVIRKVKEQHLALITEITATLIVIHEMGHVHLFGLEPQFHAYIMLASALLIIGTTSSFRFRLIVSLMGVSLLILVNEVFEDVPPFVVLSDRTINFFKSFNYSSVIILFFLVFIYFYRWIEISLKEIRINNLEAVRLAEIRARFLATMAHELRTPLNGITGISELMLERRLKESEAKDVRTIHEASISMAAIIDELLEFSRIDSGKQEAAYIQYQLYDVLKDAIMLTTTKHRSKMFDILVDIDPKTPANMLGDPLKLRQILVNLLDNAMKYTFEGAVSIRVFHTNTNGSSELTCIIKDTGIGIKKDVQPYIFDVYTHMNMRRKDIEGIGLGLAITKRYVEMLKGTLTMESVYGKGSTFVVTIPGEMVGDLKIGELHFSRVKGLNTWQELPKEKETNRLPESIGEINVLVVDDNTLNLRIVDSFLSVLGAQAYTVDRAEEALEVLRHRADIDLIMTDIHVKDMNINDYLRRIREIVSQSKPIPLIAMTGDSTVYDSDWQNELQADAMMIKPLSMDRVKRTILAVLAKNSHL